MHEHDSMLIGNYKSNKSIGLVTSKGWEIPNERRPREMNMEIQRETAKKLMEAYPNIKLRSLSWDYNCVGLVFASRRTAIDPKFLLKILDDDGYVPVSIEKLHCGDVVVYRDRAGEPAHVGIVLDKVPHVANATFKIKVLSQWGNSGEFVHDVSDVNKEWTAKPVEYWSERKT